MVFPPEKRLVFLVLLPLLVVMAQTANSEVREEKGSILAGLGTTPHDASGRFEDLYQDAGLSFRLGLELAWKPRYRPVFKLDYFSFPFDEDGFYDREEVSRAVPVDGSPAKVNLGMIGMRIFPAWLRIVKPYVDVSVVIGRVDEEYSYSDLEYNGGFFPSGTLISRDNPRSVNGFGGAVGFRLEISRGAVDAFGEAGYYQLWGDELRFDVVPIRFGLAIAIY